MPTSWFRTLVAIRAAPGLLPAIPATERPAGDGATRGPRGRIESGVQTVEAAGLVRDRAIELGRVAVHDPDYAHVYAGR
jgi:hypothetical protein